MHINLNTEDLNQWIDNDEGLYNWWKGSRQSKRQFIQENRQELKDCILGFLNRKPAEKHYYDY